jgi:hypothetical protein
VPIGKASTKSFFAVNNITVKLSVTILSINSYVDGSKGLAIRPAEES